MFHYRSRSVNGQVLMTENITMGSVCTVNRTTAKSDSYPRALERCKYQLLINMDNCNLKQAEDIRINIITIDIIQQNVSASVSHISDDPDF